MHAAGHIYNVLSPTEEDIIHANVLRIVDQVGLQVENEALLERVAANGGRVDSETKRFTFSPAAAEGFLADSVRVPWDQEPPQLNAGVNLYYGYYLDPANDEFLSMTVERAQQYFQLARALPHVRSLGILGCPLEGISPAVEPLYERFWAWSLGVRPGGSIHQVRHCPYILELCEAHAAATGQALRDVLTAVVYLVPPLKLAHQEAEQVAWFLERGLRVGIGGSMATGGATAPVTLAGMVTLTLAENLLVGLLNRALYGDRSWSIWMSATAMDPRTAMRPYGRPDMVLANLMGAQMARRYGCGYSGHCGLSDAMRPSPQAAAQKVQSALPTLMATGRASIEAGLLAVDEVFSPVQMVLDAELASALGQFAHEYEVSDASIGADVVAAVGPGGTFAMEMHTAQWFRQELWQPTIWERRLFSAWQAQDGKSDVDRARERVQAILSRPPAGSAISPEEEQELLQIIQKALPL